MRKRLESTASGRGIVLSDGCDVDEFSFDELFNFDELIKNLFPKGG